MNIDADWRVGRGYIAKESVKKLFEPELEKITKNDVLIIDESFINLEAQSIIYTT